MAKFKKYLFLTDVHFKATDSEHSKTVFSIAKQVAKDLKPDGLAFLGDMIDCEGISKFTYKDWKDGAYETIEDIYTFKEKYFNPLVKACKNPNLDIKYCLGNHEYRIVDYLDKIKQKECRASYEDWKEKFNLRRIFPEAKIKEYNECHKLGRLYLTHGEFHCAGHAKKHAIVYRKNLIYGHLHSWQVFTTASKANNKVYSAYSIPAACNNSPKYLKNKSNAWVKGMVVGYIWPNGDYQLVPLIIVRGRVIFNNKEYHG